jgi:hypothetical protein
MRNFEAHTRLVTVLPSGLALLLVLLLSGCTNFNRLQQIPYVYHNPADATGEAKVKEAGAVYLWPPYTSAAVLDKEGKHCVLAASGAKTIDASTEAALKLDKVLEKVAGLEGSIKQSVVEAFTKISAADAHAAFVDVALFHLCILEQNGAFANGQAEKRKMMLDAYMKTIEAAQGVEVAPEPRSERATTETSDGRAVDEKLGEASLSNKNASLPSNSARPPGR